MLANSDLVLGSQSLDGFDRDALTDVREAAETLHRMVLNLLDIQAGEDGRLDPELTVVSTLEALEEVARASAGRAGDVTIRVEHFGVGSDPEVPADPELLRRILTNLVDNCLKYGPSDGTIWLRVRKSGDDAVLFQVSDEGPGVPPDLRGAIFERYAKVERDNARRDPTSRGLGLRFCKLAVEAHHGSIWVEDNEPKGARFCFELPTDPNPT
ncbi:MAG: sensor histidine kinase [Longimicrobiales bacterium]